MGQLWNLHSIGVRGTSRCKGCITQEEEVDAKAKTKADANAKAKVVHTGIYIVQMHIHVHLNNVYACPFQSLHATHHGVCPGVRP